ncbi:hypothetical protein THIOM_000866 [Candidatus Thiomargarita nelsonii]|uniref:Uncharacterized protein n=1 Tax=Candidatus Thiomargarita nelsonii TaxID=1003181 RepID=A0A176S5L5_9GAMM|nr:hypothetical protein THIOM_000866 [Candidatus Thiomargarita nelsonii]
MATTSTKFPLTVEPSSIKGLSVFRGQFPLTAFKVFWSIPNKSAVPLSLITAVSSSSTYPSHIMPGINSTWP